MFSCAPGGTAQTKGYKQTKPEYIIYILYKILFCNIRFRLKYQKPTLKMLVYVKAGAIMVIIKW